MKDLPIIIFMTFSFILGIIVAVLTEETKEVKQIVTPSVRIEVKEGVADTTYIYKF